ncbi:MAG: ATPase, T2SS/T4P/T4SS family [Byssovorax sp.]
MFAVIISEKGGAERRESFDRTELNVGRVQGNDLVLPKGNVSKRHARLLFRDGRFIVTDLKSTNGTYVNGRKIAQATIVREGDKIYIGDFVLRIETGAGGSAGVTSPPLVGPSGITDEPSVEVAPPSVPPGPAPVGAPTAAQVPVAALLGPEAIRPTLGSAPDLGALDPPKPPPTRASATPLPLPATAPPAAPPQAGALFEPTPGTGDTPPGQFSAEKAIARPPTPRIEPKTGDVQRQDIISHFPLEHDPDDSVQYSVPGPPRMPSATRPSAPVAPAAPPARPVPASGPPPYDPGPGRPIGPAPVPVERAPAPPVPAERAPSHSPGAPLQGGTMLSSSTPPAAPVRRALLPTGLEPEGGPSSQVAAHRAALATLVDRATEGLDLRALDAGADPDAALTARLDQALRDRAQAMKTRGELPAGIDQDILIGEARRELLELGPLGAMLDDEDVSEIQVVRSDYVVALHGRRSVPTDVGFSSERAVGRVIRRLCVQAGRPLGAGESFVERRLPRGGRLFAVLPPTPEQGHMVVLRKPQRADLSLEDLVRSGTISRAMAGFFAQCVEARANILVTGSLGAGATSLLGALAAAGSTEDRVVVLQEDDELIFNQPHTVSILLGDTAEEGARAVQAAARVRPDRLVVGAFAGPVAAEVVDAIGDGVDGVLAAARAPTLRQAAARLTADLSATRPGLSPEVAREWLVSAFDLAIEIARQKDGRHRVLRVAELAIDGGRVVVKDIFTFAVERTAAGGAVEGSFHPTGFIPGIVEDLAARGAPVDSGLFKRSREATPLPR